MKYFLGIALLLSLLNGSSLLFAQEDAEKNTETGDAKTPIISKPKTYYNIWKPNGIGAKYGAGSIWLAYKRYFKKFAIEANLGYYAGGQLGFIPRVQVNFIKQYDIKPIENLQWYWGIGAHYQAATQPYFEVGPNGLVGIEYNIIDWHISIYTDIGISTGYRGKYKEGPVASVPASAGIRFRW